MGTEAGIWKEQWWEQRLGFGKNSDGNRGRGLVRTVVGTGWVLERTVMEKEAGTNQNGGGHRRMKTPWARGRGTGKQLSFEQAVMRAKFFKVPVTHTYMYATSFTIWMWTLLCSHAGDIMYHSNTAKYLFLMGDWPSFNCFTPEWHMVCNWFYLLSPNHHIMCSLTLLHLIRVYYRNLASPLTLYI